MKRKRSPPRYQPGGRFMRYLLHHFSKPPRGVDFSFASSSCRSNRVIRKYRNKILRRRYRNRMDVIMDGRKVASVNQIVRVGEDGERVYVLECNEYTPIRHWLANKYPASFSVLDTSVLQWTKTWQPCQEILDMIAAVLNGCSAYFYTQPYHGALDNTDNFLVRQLPPKYGQTHGDIEVKIAPVAVQLDSGRTVLEAQDDDIQNISRLISQFLLPPDGRYPYALIDLVRRVNERDPAISSRRDHLRRLGSLSRHPGVWSPHQKKSYVVKLMIAHNAQGPTSRIAQPGLDNNAGIAHVMDGIVVLGKDGSDWVTYVENTVGPLHTFLSDAYNDSTSSLCNFVYNFYKHVEAYADKKNENDIWRNEKFSEHMVSQAFPTFVVDLYYAMMEGGYAYLY